MHAARHSLNWTFDSAPNMTACSLMALLLSSLVMPLTSAYAYVRSEQRERNPWPNLLQDGFHSGAAGLELEMPETLPSIRWKFKAPGEVESSAVLSEDLVFAAGGREIFAVNKKTGEKEWSFSAKKQVLATGALGGGKYFIGTDDKHFYALDQRTGKLQWKFPAGEFTGAAIVDEDAGTVYAGSGANKLHAYSFDGKKQFEFKTSAQVASTPGLDKKGGVYFGDDNGYFYKVNTRTGQQEWKLKFESGIRSPPRMEKDSIYLGIGDPDEKTSGEIVRLSYDGRVIWHSDCGGRKHKCESCWTSPALVNGVVIAGCGLDGIRSGHVWGLSERDGSPIWQFKAKNDCQTSSPVVMGSGDAAGVAIGCTDGMLYALRARDGKKLWQFKSGKGIWATPALDSDGSIYVGSHDGHLYALGGAGALTTPVLAENHMSEEDKGLDSGKQGTRQAEEDEEKDHEADYDHEMEQDEQAENDRDASDESDEEDERGEEEDEQDEEKAHVEH